VKFSVYFQNILISHSMVSLNWRTSIVCQTSIYSQQLFHSLVDNISSNYMSMWCELFKSGSSPQSTYPAFYEARDLSFPLTYIPSNIVKCRLGGIKT